MEIQLDKIESKNEYNKMMKKRDELNAVFIKNQESVLKRYGFSLMHDYLLRVEQSRIFRTIDEPLAQSLIESKKATEAALITYGGKPMIHVATLQGVDANIEFQQNLSLVKAQRQHIEELALEIQSSDDKEKKISKNLFLQSLLDETLNIYKNNLEKLQQSYGIDLNGKFFVDVQLSHVYLLKPKDASLKK